MKLTSEQRNKSTIVMLDIIKFLYQSYSIPMVEQFHQGNPVIRNGEFYIKQSQ